MAKPKTPPKIDLNSKAAKYFFGHTKEGKTKTQAMIAAGFGSASNITNVEKTHTYQALKAKYADKIEQKISMDEVAEEHKKVILQERDLGAKNKAIQMYMERVDPVESEKGEDDDRMIIVLR